ncbi:MAG: hypothetical protein R3175_02395 [Marinobacter sp.]|uniref:hypothetical protein n=1 Tax=Marinobacter sp. TaxID=50741 RepID=UPI00299EBE71|nr:hypothetical protein [Marinobacter sp.]MDX1754887.1 hypothetical protein [Marinobacter sp.]
MSQIPLARKLFPSLLVIALSSTAAHSAPSISNISTSSDGNSIVINGSGFSSGPNVVLFDNFESGSQDGAPIGLESPNYGTWSSYGGDGQAKYAKESDGNTGFYVRDFAAGGKGLAQLIKVFDRSYSTIYFSFSAKVPEGNTFAGSSSPKSFPNVSSWKLSWLMSGSTGYNSGDGNFDLCIPTHVGYGAFQVGGNDGVLSWVDDGDQWWSWTDFNDISYYMDYGSSINWVLNFNSGKGFHTRSGNESSSKLGGNGTFDRINMPGWWGNGDNSNFSGIYDNIYIAVGNNSLSRVMITNSSTISNSTRSITVPPSNWGSSQIQVNADVIPDWSNLYVHVSDSSGNMTSQGYPLDEVPTSSCPQCPSPPSNPVIQ